MDTQKPAKRQIVSFTLDPEANASLSQLEKHTVFVAAVVTKALGRCPCCNQAWPKKRRHIAAIPTEHKTDGQ